MNEDSSVIYLDTNLSVCIEKLDEKCSKLVFYDNNNKEVKYPDNFKLFVKKELNEYLIMKPIIHWGDNYIIRYNNIEISILSKKSFDIKIKR